VALGTRLVPVAACEGLCHSWPAALGQSALHPHGGGATASLDAAQKAFEESATGSRSQAPAHGLCHHATQPPPCPHGLARCTEGAGTISVAVSSKEEREAENDPLGTS